MTQTEKWTIPARYRSSANETGKDLWGSKRTRIHEQSTRIPEQFTRIYE